MTDEERLQVAKDLSDQAQDAFYWVYTHVNNPLLLNLVKSVRDKPYSELTAIHDSLKQSSMSKSTCKPGPSTSTDIGTLLGCPIKK